MSKSEAIITVVNLAVCMVGFLMCICRNGLMSHHTKGVIRAQYAIWVSYFVASGISFTFDVPASVIQLGMSTAVVVHLLLGFEAWKSGAPKYTVRERKIITEMGD